VNFGSIFQVELPRLEMWRRHLNKVVAA
jgi:hypothetical protein